ncbi:hypothetical protein E2C01_064116 [Portunus trituberculatus]|uniref:Uncharacterized protein n=1 Tax=Portunus trituberculatus TaxID=210409 RepID=A0A5B7HJZ8_PORTR|nr:hypothetical protein [Portunus trituberculatus]
MRVSSSCFSCVRAVTSACGKKKTVTTPLSQLPASSGGSYFGSDISKSVKVFQVFYQVHVLELVTTKKLSMNIWSAISNSHIGHYLLGVLLQFLVMVLCGLCCQVRNLELLAIGGCQDSVVLCLSQLLLQLTQLLFHGYLIAVKKGEE